MALSTGPRLDNGAPLQGWVTDLLSSLQEVFMCAEGEGGGREEEREIEEERKEEGGGAILWKQSL